MADAASMLITADSRASAMCRCRDGSRPPVKVCRSAVAMPTAISLRASPRDPPVAAAMRRVGL
ncbi:hypothetical protein [Agromyces sp. ZXT2-6]|uniref:hypothetical protein n=1 Tax=Agromyces sp. ZXT2-6 TaxID=3461153 RepID=UPI004055241E